MFGIRQARTIANLAAFVIGLALFALIAWGLA